MRALTLDSNNLFRDRSFTLYFLAGAISGAGSTITLVVLPILVFQLTQSASSLLVVYAVRALSFSDTDARIGLFFTAGAVGSLLASLALPRLTKSISPARLTLACLLPNALFGFVFAFAPNWIFAIVAYVVRQVFYFLIIINGISLRQQVTPDHLSSRVNATARMIAWGGAPFGAAVGGVLAEVTDIRMTFFLVSILMSALVVIGWFSPLRDSDLK